MSFPRYAKYKDSGVEWLGEVPAHWEYGNLRSVRYDWQRTSSDDRLRRVSYEDGDIRLARYGAISTTAN